MKTLWLDALHFREQSLVIGGPALAIVHAPVTGWAETNYELWMIRAAVTYAANVMRLEVGFTIRAQEWGAALTSLTSSSSASENVIAHIAASLINVTRATIFLNHVLGSLECSLTQFLQRHFRCRRVFENRVNAVERAQLKHNGFAHCLLAIGRLPFVVAVTNHLIQIAKATLLLSKKVKAFALAAMRSNGEVAIAHLHRTNLALTEIFEDAIIAQPIRIAVLLALRSRDDDDEREVLRGDDAALLLPAVLRVDFIFAVIKAAFFKWRDQHIPPAFAPTCFFEPSQRINP